MQLIDFKAKTKKWNHFAQVDTLGSFDFYTSLLSLDGINEADILAMQGVFPGQLDVETFAKAKKLTAEQYALLSKVLPLAVHEYTHFVDSTSTLWGLRHLKQMNDAYLSNDKKGGKEIDFYKAKNFYNHVRGIHLPSYYTLKHPETSNIRPWRSEITIGRVFSSQGEISQNTVLFSIFSNLYDQPLVRSPISTVSLLEASAMAQETLIHTALIAFTDEDFRIVEGANFATRLLDYLYNPEITEYSVCAHVVANQLNCKDVLSAFMVCAAITRIVLNFPRTAFEAVAEACPIAEILRIPSDHDFNNAIVDGIKNYNLGVIYYLLCNALPKNSHESRQKLAAGIVSAIQAIGVDFDTISNDAQCEAKALFESINTGGIEAISTLATAGYENFNRIGFNGINLEFKNICLPPALMGDSSKCLLFGKNNNLLANFDIDECFDELYAGQLWVERFSEACL